MRPFGNRRRTWLALVIAPWACCLASCATVEHAHEFDQAARQLRASSNLESRWSDNSDVAVLQLDENGALSLDRAIELALANNRTLRADLEQIASAKADLVQAGLLSNPILSFLVRFPEGGGRANLDFGLSKDIAELWLIPSRKRAAQRLLQRTILSFTDSAVALVNEVKVTYFRLHYQAAAIEMQTRNLQVLRKAQELAQARFRAGDSSQLDVNLTNGRLIEAELELLALRSEFGATQRSLLRQIGSADFFGEWKTLSVDAPLLPHLDDESIVVNAALERRLDVLAAWWELEAAVAEVEQQRRRVFPTFGLGISGERPERRATPGRDVLADTVRSSVREGQLTAPEVQSRSERREERSAEIDFILGPSIDVPLPIFDQNLAQVAKAQARARELKRRYEETQQRVIEGVRAALQAYRLADERVRLFRSSLLPQQDANLRFAEESYKAGQENILVVLLAQEGLIKSQLGSAAAERDRASSAANLERQLGGRIPEFLHPTGDPHDGG